MLSRCPQLIQLQAQDKGQAMEPQRSQFCLLYVWQQGYLLMVSWKGIHGNYGNQERDNECHMQVGDRRYLRSLVCGEEDWKAVGVTVGGDFHHAHLPPC